MGKTMREKAVMATLGVIVLYAIAVAIWFLSAESAWKTSSRAYARAKTAYREELKLIGEKKMWAARYEAEKALMPTFAAGKSTDPTWGRTLLKLAEKNHIAISGTQPGVEMTADDVLVMPIEVRGWEGSLESLVHLMHDLENPEEGMFDIAQLRISPSSKRGYLRGSFTLNCAYMREK